MAVQHSSAHGHNALGLRFRQLNQDRCRQHEDSQVTEDQSEIASGDVQKAAAEPGSNKTGNKAISGKDQADNGAEVIHAETVADEGGRNGKQRAKSISDGRKQRQPGQRNALEVGQYLKEIS